MEQGLYDRVSLLAFDARQTPFAANSISLLTSFVGLPNIQNPGNLLKELHRVVNGKFIAVSHFYPEDDLENGAVINELGVTEMLFRNRLLTHFRNAEWTVEVKNNISIKTNAMPTGIVLEGAKVDPLPAYDTCLDWCILSASNAKQQHESGA